MLLSDLEHTEEMVNCSAVDQGQFVGPAEVYASIHHWNTAVYLILAVHAIPMWIISARVILGLQLTCVSELRSSLLNVSLVPPLYMLVSAIGIILPSTGPFVQLIGDLVISCGIVQFVVFTTKLSGGSRQFVQRCVESETRMPISAPPFICLTIVEPPIVTLRKLNIIQVLPVILIFLKLALMVIKIIESALYDTKDEHLSELARYLSIPVGLAGIYTYTIYIILVAQVLETRAKSLGFVLLGLFVLSDATELFFLFLASTKMLTCVAPAMLLISVQHLIKNCIKGFLVFVAGLPYLKICSEKYEVLQVKPSRTET